MRRALGLVVLLAILAGFAGLRGYDRPGPLPCVRDVVVPRGGLAMVGDALTQAGVVGDAWLFRIAALATRGDGALHAAELEFPAHASLRTVLAILRQARPVQHRLTIPEGLTSEEIVTIIRQAPALTGDLAPPPEGSVLPQTYAYEWGMPRVVVLERAQAAMTHALAEAWAARAPGLALASPAQALVLASMIERETARPEERGHVAAVFLNRLRLGMRLQSDPTVIFGVTGGMGAQDRKLSRADLRHDDPSNTYRIEGLPPGPICAPGVAALRAATQPDASEDLYFVADGSGGHAFARTLEAHERNVARWRGH